MISIIKFCNRKLISHLIYFLLLALQVSPLEYKQLHNVKINFLFCDILKFKQENLKIAQKFAIYLSKIFK